MQETALPCKPYPMQRLLVLCISTSARRIQSNDGFSLQATVSVDKLLHTTEPGLSVWSLRRAFALLFSTHFDQSSIFNAILMASLKTRLIKEKADRYGSCKETFRRRAVALQVRLTQQMSCIAVFSQKRFLEMPIRQSGKTAENNKKEGNYHGQQHGKQTEKKSYKENAQI